MKIRATKAFLFRFRASLQTQIKEAMKKKMKAISSGTTTMNGPFIWKPLGPELNPAGLNRNLIMSPII